MEILHTYTYNNTGWVALGAVFFIVTVAMVICTLGSLIIDFNKWKNHIAFLLVGILCTIGLVATYKIDRMFDEVRHDVLIYDMSEFDINKYKIVTQQGKVFTIEEIK